MVRKSHTPWRSGWPSAVRGTAELFAATVVAGAEADWPATGAGISNAAAITIAGPLVELRNRWFIRTSSSPARLLAEMPVHELLHELYALELQHLSVLFQPTIDGHADLPGPRKHLRVLDRRFIGQGINGEGSVAFDHMQRVAMEIPGPVEPGLIVQTRHVDDETIALPVADRVPHPTVSRAWRRLVHVDRAGGARILIGHQDDVRTLNNLKRIGHIRGARHARQITLDFRVSDQAVFKVLFLFRGRRGQVGDIIPLHDAWPRRHCADRTEGHHLSRSRRMLLEVPVCRVDSLPDTVQVWFAVRCTSRIIGFGQTGGRCQAQRKGGQRGCSSRKSRA